ncbi:MAG: EthD domain-containing protein [Candidatus Tectomicrobia bacterium]|uniref:EthD domain-containing protein n=1 Tax=Tectimicrobiota bacterium TaxID=2528274 RepID=A0A933LRQ0_UNCTE|nr:EthD domain-containing protein [Candidatus Tectomicrobia bacterium]
MLKLITFIKRKPGMGVDEFHRYWREVHGQIAKKIPGIRKYIQCHTTASGYQDGKEPLYDGTAEVWFDDLEALRRSAGTAEYKATMADEANFIDPALRKFIITEEHHVI